MKAERIQEKIEELTGWELNGDGTAIFRTYSFPSYRVGVAFANFVAEIAETFDHHPDLTIGYCSVTVSLSSHDVGGVSRRDFKFARALDGVAD